VHIQPGATADCDTTDLNNISNGNAYLTAQYHANTITFTYDANGGTTSNGGTWTNNAATQCTYDTNFNLPTAPTKTGYNFDGWKVKFQCMVESVCGLNGSAVDALTMDSFEFNDAGNAWWCHGSKNCTNAFVCNGCGGGYSCDNYSTHFLEQQAGTWAVHFTNGAYVHGVASCNNTTSGLVTMCTDYYDQIDVLEQQLMTAIENGEMTEEEAMAWAQTWMAEHDPGIVYETCDAGMFQPTNTFDTTSTGQYCWCRMTKYIAPNGSIYNTPRSLWVNVGVNAQSCSGSSCQSACAGLFGISNTTKRAIFMSAGQCQQSGGNSGNAE